MNLSEIKAAMQLYASKCNQSGATQMKTWYGQGNMFTYARDASNAPVPPATEAYVHVYFGIDTSGALKALVISANKDVSTNSTIASDVQVCGMSMSDPSSTGTNNGGIPAGEALIRIQLWKNNYTNWIDANIGSSQSIFKAFGLPNSDTAFGTIHNGFLGLLNTTPVTSAQADIIVQDVDSSVVEFYDSGLPVPPFPAAGYYLLALAGS